MNYFQIFIFILVIVIITLLIVYNQSLTGSIMNNYNKLGSFQRIVTLITLILLVIIFVFVILNLSFAKKKESWPPVVPDCPDFWETSQSDDGEVKCINTQDLGTCTPANGDTHLEMNFNSAEFASNCAKYTWANNCGLAWDGITYGVSNPCQTD